MPTFAALLLLIPAVQDSILDPTSWPSRSEAFVLDVEPCRRSGGGPANHQLTQRGTTVWSGQRPFTLWQAAVTDAGTVLGYAYTEGVHSSKGELQLIRIGIDGQATILDAKPRRPPASPHGASSPRGLDVVLEEDLDRAIIGLQGGPPWYVQISTGKLLPPFRPVKPWTSRARPRSRVPVPPSTPVSLEFLGSVSLGGEPSDWEIASIPRAFGDGDPGVGGVRPNSEWTGWDLVIRDDGRKVLSSIPLGALRGAGCIDGTDRPQSVRTGPHSWVITVSETGRPARSHAWSVDDRAGEARELEDFECPAVWALAPLPEGGFVVLANHRTEDSSTTHLIAFDREGRTTWTVAPTREIGDRTRMFAPGSVKVTAERKVVVEDPVRELVQVFDASGRFLESLDREGSPPRNPEPPRAPTWLSEVEVDWAGRILALEYDRREIHVFDADGRLSRTCRPDPSDYAPDLQLRSLAFGPDGSVYANDRLQRRGADRRVRFLAFGPDGTRRGWESLGFDTITERWRFKPEGGERWVLGLRDLFLVAADGSLRRRIDRQPDGRWIREPRDLAVAPDGSAALLTVMNSGFPDAESAIHLYDADGAERRSFVVPKDVAEWSPAVVWTGRWIVVARDGGRFLLIDTESDRRIDYVPPWIGAGGAGLDPFLSGGGRELWLVDRETRIVRRVSLPGD